MNSNMTMRQGIIAFQELPRFIELHGMRVDLNAGEGFTILTFAHGDSNYLVKETATNLGAWGNNFIEGTEYWLYWDIDLQTGKLSYGNTLIEPTFGDTFPLSPTVDEHFFDMNSMIMKVWDGNKWLDKIRLFAGHIRTDFTLNPKGAYSQINVYGNFISKELYFDSNNNPVQVFSNDNYLLAQKNNKGNAPKNTTSFNYEGIEGFYGIASEEIPKNTCITWDTETKTIKKASFNDIENPCFGISETLIPSGDLGRIITKGFVTNKYDWLWKLPENTSLFVGEEGDITTTPSRVISAQKIGHIVSTETIFLNINEQIIIDPII